PAPPVRLAKAFRDALGEAGQGRSFRPERRKHDPVRPLARELGKHARLQNARLAAAGSPENQEKASSALDAPPLQSFPHFADFVVAAEENRRILPIERRNPGIGRPRRIPLESARNLLADFADASSQVVLAVGIPVLEIDALDLRSNTLVADR